MKHTQRLINGLAASAIALAMASTLTAQTAVDGTATVIRVQGPARYTTGNNVWQPLHPGAVLSPGTIVQTSTERGSYVDMVLNDGGKAVATPSGLRYAPHIPNSMNTGYQTATEQNAIRIWENTALGIDKLSATDTGADRVTDTQLDLKSGRITGKAKKMSAASKYEIKLPNGVAGIRGTSFDIQSDGVVRVVVGSVVLAWVNPTSGQVNTQVVTGGNQYDARTGQMGPIPAAELASLSPVITGMSMVTPAVESQITYTADRTITMVSPIVAPLHN